MISNELLNEIIEISEKGQLLDSKMIRKIVKEVVSNIDRYSRNLFGPLRFKQSKVFNAETNISTGEMRFCLENCYKDINAIKDATVLEKNLHLLGTILHEVEHLQEQYKLRKGKIEGKLINVSNYQVDYLIDEELNEDTYYVNPSEKIAYGLSYRKLIDILSNHPNFTKKYPKVFKNIYNTYIMNLELGYNLDMPNVPLIDFITSFDDVEYLKQIKIRLSRKRNMFKINKMDLEDRFMYGMPVSKRHVKLLERKFK